jgi:hypothetical protein
MPSLGTGLAMACRPKEVHHSDMEDDEDRLLVALGRITESSTTMEWVLRLAFCCLVGSKYAAVGIIFVWGR